jgi:hypothetical protein
MSKIWETKADEINKKRDASLKLIAQLHKTHSIAHLKQISLIMDAKSPKQLSLE